jgi:hypothetical protein
MRARVLATLVGAGLVVASGGFPSEARAQAPACPAGTPSALAIEGLPDRVLVGPEHVFALLDDDPDWIVASRLTITTEVDGTVRSERKTDQVAEASLQLDDGDQRASVTITFIQEPAAEDAPPCTQTVARKVVGFRRYTIGNCLDLSYRPRRIIVACGDGNYQLLRIRWRDWNARSQRVRARRGSTTAIPTVPPAGFTAIASDCGRAGCAVVAPVRSTSASTSTPVSE